MSLMRRVLDLLRGRPSQPEGGRERREYQRILARFAVAFSGEHTKGKAVAVDLSLGGCMIETDTPLPMDTLLELKLFLTEQDMPLDVAASVRWTAGKRVGIKFLRVRDSDRLRKFLGAAAPQDVR